MTKELSDNELSKYRLDEIGFGSLKLYQDPSDFCYGIDAVLLSDFASKSSPNTVVDLGCGNGIIPLILSHKTQASSIIGVEKRTKTASLASMNIKLNNLQSRIKIIQTDILGLLQIDKKYINPESVDVVVSNPPYVAKGAGQVNSNKEDKMTARHETTAGLNDFCHVASLLLKNKGEFFIVHRPSRTVEIINSLTKYNLEPKEIRYVSPSKGKDPNIMLIKAIKNGGSESLIREPLYVYNSDGSYTDEIMRMYEKVD